MLNYLTSSFVTLALVIDAIGLSPPRKRDPRQPTPVTLGDFDLNHGQIETVRFAPFMEWQPIAAAPFDHNLELAVINYHGAHALRVSMLPHSQWLAEIRHSRARQCATDALARVERVQLSSLFSGPDA
jgi:hypothetical protein